MLRRWREISEVFRKTFSDDAGEIWNMRGALLRGKDLAGNEYWESPPKSGSNRTRRSLRVVSEEHNNLRKFDTSQMVENFGTQRLPVEWNSWLQHRRSDPPSLQELQENQERAQVRAENAQRLKEKDEQMRLKEIEEGLITTTQVSHASRKAPLGSQISGPEGQSSGTQYQPGSWQPSSDPNKGAGDDGRASDKTPPKA